MVAILGNERLRCHKEGEEWGQRVLIQDTSGTSYFTASAIQRRKKEEEKDVEGSCTGKLKEMKWEGKERTWSGTVKKRRTLQLRPHKEVDESKKRTFVGAVLGNGSRWDERGKKERGKGVCYKTVKKRLSLLLRPREEGDISKRRAIVRAVLGNESRWNEKRKEERTR